MATTDAPRKTKSRILLLVLSILALCAWGGLLIFTRYVPPRGLSIFILFFVLLGLALICTLTPLIYLVTRVILIRHSYRPILIQTLRQATLLSTWVGFNLLLRLLSSWSIFTAIVSFGIIVVIEILVLGRI